MLICDVEGTIFKPHMDKDTEHPSYIWAGLAAHLGADAEREEGESHQKWKLGGYGDHNYGESYIKWVKASIDIHKRFGLTKSGFEGVVNAAQYHEGCLEFFSRLNRKEYIPVLISGGIKQFSSRACADLGILEENSYAACSYFFSHGQIDSDLSLVNTSNFFGKQEIVKIALRKHGLGEGDWFFFGDGPNDVSVAKEAPISVGISPLPELQKVVTHSYKDFSELMSDQSFLQKTGLLLDDCASGEIAPPPGDIKQLAKQRVDSQIGNLAIADLQARAAARMSEICGASDYRLQTLHGIEQLLRAGEEVLLFCRLDQKDKKVVSAILQPFSNAAEVMVNVCDVLDNTEQRIRDEKNSFIDLDSKIQSLSRIPLELRDVLTEFRALRNISAHNYKRIPIEAAYNIAQRTYELIQRLELMYYNK